MSRSARRPSTGRRSTSKQAFRRMNRAVDHSQRNKRRTFAAICAAVVMVAAALALALALAPVFGG